MRIYNKGHFISGIVMVLLGLLNLGLAIVRSDLDISLGVLLLGLFSLGGHFIYRLISIGEISKVLMQMIPRFF